MSDKFFIDTNILVYTFYKDDKAKRVKAIDIMDEAISKEKGCISYQVVQEFFNVALKKFAIPLSHEDCREFYHSVLEPICEVHSSNHLYLDALDIADRWRYSFYDSLIISAAMQADCNILYSEDLQHGQIIQDLKIINPFV